MCVVFRQFNSFLVVYHFNSVDFEIKIYLNIYVGAETLHLATRMGSPLFGAIEHFNSDKGEDLFLPGGAHGLISSGQ